MSNTNVANIASTTDNTTISKQVTIVPLNQYCNQRLPCGEVIGRVGTTYKVVRYAVVAGSGIMLIVKSTQELAQQWITKKGYTVSLA